jgi:hypothetical protein
LTGEAFATGLAPVSLSFFALAAGTFAAGEAFAFTAGDATGDAVGDATGNAVGVATNLFALLVLFAGASPQAIPRALRPKTAESAITFVISLFRLLSLLKV